MFIVPLCIFQLFSFNTQVHELRSLCTDCCFVSSEIYWSSNLTSLLVSQGLDSDESYEGVSEASFKDALVFDGSSQKDNGSVPQENGIKKHRCCSIPAPHSTCTHLSARVCVFTTVICPETIQNPLLLNTVQWAGQGHHCRANNMNLRFWDTGTESTLSCWRKSVSCSHDMDFKYTRRGE